MNKPVNDRRPAIRGTMRSCVTLIALSLLLVGTPMPGSLAHPPAGPGAPSAAAGGRSPGHLLDAARLSLLAGNGPARPAGAPHPGGGLSQKSGPAPSLKLVPG
ncbi:MAG: hypothetical protein L3K09_04500, partial [Thermoplasmata archaeon]|nr:hypothetical protein [Thermoplasmata archaeon]